MGWLACLSLGKSWSMRKKIAFNCAGFFQRGPGDRVVSFVLCLGMKKILLCLLLSTGEMGGEHVYR